MSFLEFFKLEKDKRGIVSSSSKSKKGENVGEKKGKRSSSFKFDFLERECVFLLSRFLNDPTVDSLRDKKESCSMRIGLPAGTRLKEFRQTPRGRGFSILGFYSLFKSYVNI